MPPKLSEKLTIIIYLSDWKIRPSVNELQMVPVSYPLLTPLKMHRHSFYINTPQAPPIPIIKMKKLNTRHLFPIHSFFIVKTKAVLLLFIGLNNPLEAKQTNKSMLFINKNAFLFPKAQIFEAHPH